MPTWALTLELQCLGSRAPKLVADELLSRCVKGNVSDSALRAAAVAATRMRTGDESLAPSLNQLVGDAATGGLISKDLLAQHVAVPLMLEADVPARMRLGDPLVNGLINITGADSRTPPDGTWIIGRRITGIEIDGVLTPARTVQSPKDAEWAPGLILTPHTTTYVQRPGPQDVVAVPVQPSLSVGKHTVRLHFCVDVFKGMGDKAPGRAAAWRDYPVEVVASDGALVTLADDPGFRNAVAERLAPSVVRTPGGVAWQVSVKPGVTVPPLPPGATVQSRIGGAWDVVVEINGKRQTPGKAKVVWDASGSVYPSSFYGPNLRLPAEAETCRVILVPNERFAAQRGAVDVMPAGEIVFEDVLIR